MFPKEKWLGKNSSKSSLKSKLDTVFSTFIRLRDITYSTRSTANIIQCISCGRLVPWKETDAGHFVNRNKMATRWNPKNVNAQCKKCNRFESGKQYEHGIAIDKKYGIGTADNLISLSKMYCKYSDEQLDLEIKLYRDKVKQLKKELGI